MKASTMDRAMGVLSKNDVNRVQTSVRMYDEAQAAYWDLSPEKLSAAIQAMLGDLTDDGFSLAESLAIVAEIAKRA